MLVSFLSVGQQVLILFILIAAGYISSKKKLITKESIVGMTNLILYGVTPCVIIDAFHRPFESSMLTGLGIACLAAFGVHIMNILLAHFFIRDKEESRERVLKFAAVFSNCGYMSLPLQYALLGADGVFYGAAYIAVFNVFSWTYGIVLMGASGEKMKLRQVIINPGIIGVAAGLIIFLAQIKLPSIVLSPIKSFAAMNTPLPMVVIGYYLSNITSAAVFKDKKMWFVIFIRLIVSPVLALFLIRAAGVRGAVLASLVISASAPTAANTAMYASKFGRDTELASSTVSISTLCSILTMPVVVAAAMIL